VTNKIVISQFALSIFSMVGNILVGYHKKWIWRFAHTQNAFSALYFIITKQYGFLIENAFYVGIFINNQKQWKLQELGEK